VTKEEWKRRFVVRIMDESGMQAKHAVESAEDAYVFYIEGGSADVFGESPEGAADEDMRHWEDSA
jgi:hypothetical protein